MCPKYVPNNITTLQSVDAWRFHVTRLLSSNKKYPVFVRKLRQFPQNTTKFAPPNDNHAGIASGTSEMYFTNNLGPSKNVEGSRCFQEPWVRMTIPTWKHQQYGSGMRPSDIIRISFNLPARSATSLLIPPKKEKNRSLMTNNKNEDDFNKIETFYRLATLYHCLLRDEGFWTYPSKACVFKPLFSKIMSPIYNLLIFTSTA